MGQKSGGSKCQPSDKKLAASECHGILFGVHFSLHEISVVMDSI